MIVDAHAHLGILGRFSATASDLLRMADRAGIDKMIVSYLDATFSDTRAGNDVLAAAIYAHPDRILGYAAFTSAYYGPAILDEIERCVSDHGMCGLKIYSTGGHSVAEPAM